MVRKSLKQTILNIGYQSFSLRNAPLTCDIALKTKATQVNRLFSIGRQGQ